MSQEGSCNHSLVVLVENEVTQPMKNDFYFQSHVALQGSKLLNFCFPTCWLHILFSSSRSFGPLYNPSRQYPQWQYGCCWCPFFLTIYWCVFYFRIQEFTFMLCHVYAKATCLVSIPAPVIVSYQFFDDEWTSIWFVSIDSGCNLVLQRQTWHGSN